MPAQPHGDRMDAETFRRKYMNPSERELQEAVVTWAHHQPFPACLLYAIVNGQYRPDQAPEPGLVAGMPDLHLPTGRFVEGARFDSLYIELKVGSNTLTDDQERKIAELRRAGNEVRVCRSFEETTGTIENYLSDDLTLKPEEETYV